MLNKDLITYSATARAYKDSEDSIRRLIPCKQCKYVSVATLVARFLWFQPSWQILGMLYTPSTFNRVSHEIYKHISNHGRCSACPEGQPILYYCWVSAAPFDVRNMGAWNAICRNYLPVGIAPPYLIVLPGRSAFPPQSPVLSIKTFSGRLDRVSLQQSFLLKNLWEQRVYEAPELQVWPTRNSGTRQRWIIAGQKLPLCQNCNRN